MIHNCQLSNLTLNHTPTPKILGILTECKSTDNVSKPLNLELECSTFPKTLQITSPNNRYFLRKMKPVGLSLIYLIVYGDTDPVPVAQVAYYVIKHFVCTD